MRGRNDMGRIAAIPRGAGELRMIAEIFPVRQAIGTDTATMDKPGNADTLPGRKSLDLRADPKHFSNNLVPRDVGVAGRDISVEHMQVGPTTEESRVGKECGSTCRSGGSEYH